MVLKLGGLGQSKLKVLLHLRNCSELQCWLCHDTIRLSTINIPHPQPDCDKLRCPCLCVGLLHNELGHGYILSKVMVPSICPGEECGTVQTKEYRGGRLPICHVAAVAIIRTGSREDWALDCLTTWNTKNMCVGKPNLQEATASTSCSASQEHWRPFHCINV